MTEKMTKEEMETKISKFREVMKDCDDQVRELQHEITKHHGWIRDMRRTWLKEHGYKILRELTWHASVPNFSNYHIEPDLRLVCYDPSNCGELIHVLFNGENGSVATGVNGISLKYELPEYCNCCGEHEYFVIQGKVSAVRMFMTFSGVRVAIASDIESLEKKFQTKADYLHRIYDAYT